MAYSESDKHQQKRLQKLKLQLYGKEPTVIFNTKTNQTPLSTTNFHSTQTSTSEHPNYLKGDLLKILFLATLAIGSQLILYILVDRKILNF